MITSVTKSGTKMRSEETSAIVLSTSAAAAGLRLFQRVLSLTMLSLLLLSCFDPAAMSPGHFGGSGADNIGTIGLLNFGSVSSAGGRFGRGGPFASLPFAHARSVGAQRDAPHTTANDRYVESDPSTQHSTVRHKRIVGGDNAGPVRRQWMVSVQYNGDVCVCVCVCVRARERVCTV